MAQNLRFETYSAPSRRANQNTSRIQNKDGLSALCLQADAMADWYALVFMTNSPSGGDIRVVFCDAAKVGLAFTQHLCERHVNHNAGGT